MGTPLYMSPEQVNGRSVDQRSDLYSFGVTCYHMLAGHPPFRGDNAITIALMHLKETANPLEKIRPDLPPLLCRIIHKLMEKDPAHRYQTGAAVIKDLKRVSQQKFQGGDAKPLDDRPAVTALKGPLLTRIARALRHPAQFAVDLADLPLQRQLLRLGITCVLVLVCFAGIGWMRRPMNPLKVPPSSGGIPPHADATRAP